jgi:DNA-binding NtrC family response regulator
MAVRSAGRVLVVDDLPGVRHLLCTVLGHAGYETLEAEDGGAALESVRADRPDVVLCDIRMPGVDGFGVLEGAHEVDPELPIIMITGLDDVDTAVRAMRLGAYHYVNKPFRNDEVVALVERAMERRRLTTQVRDLRQQVAREGPAAGLGTGEAVARILEQVERAARSDGPMLLTGERGTGKEYVARLVHARSTRRDGPFITVDAGALPTELLECGLFGHEADAYPGATHERRGELERASGGALYIDDAAALSLGTQGRLGRFLETGRLQRVGGAALVEADVRVIAATSVELRELVSGRLFRRDLYGRLAEWHLALPPLRARQDDILYFVKRFLDETNRELGKTVQGPTPEALDQILAYAWPGNLRELRHAIKRAVLLADTRIEPAHLAITPFAERDGYEDADDLPLAQRTRHAVERIERRAILDALRAAGGNKSRAARELGIDYKTLHLKIKKYQLTTPPNGRGQPC